MRTSSIDSDIKRLVLGVVLSLGIATLCAWPLAYLSTIAVCILLASRKPITLVMSIAILIIVTLSTNVIYWAFSWLKHYPSLTLLGLFFASYITLYRTATGGSKIITLTLFMAILIIPTSMHLAPDLAWFITKWLPINVFIGFLVASVCLLAMPLSPKLKLIEDNLQFTSKKAHIRALELSLAIMPVVITLWLTASIDILMFVFLTLFVHRLVESPSLRYKVTIGYFVANTIGGALAVVTFEILIISPNLLIFLLLSLIAVSLLSLKMFTDEKNTVLSFTSINAYIALTGATVLYNVTDAEIAYVPRLTQIALISVYLLFFFALYNFVKSYFINYRGSKLS